MAARTRKIRHDENTRLKIQTSQLINRLEKHVFGKVKMTSSQVSAGLGLLRKSLPDLQNVEHSGPDGGPIQSLDLSACTDEQLKTLEKIIGPIAGGAGPDDSDQGGEGSKG